MKLRSVIELVAITRKEDVAKSMNTNNICDNIDIKCITIRNGTEISSDYFLLDLK